MNLVTKRCLRILRDQIAVACAFQSMDLNVRRGRASVAVAEVGGDDGLTGCVK
jgi:hypothetical protein